MSEESSAKPVKLQTGTTYGVIRNSPPQKHPHDGMTPGEVYAELLVVWQRIHRLESEVRMLRAQRARFATKSELRALDLEVQNELKALETKSRR